jgi:hypothetical protein
MRSPLSEEAELAALLCEIPAKELADALVGKFNEVCDEEGQRLLGEACGWRRVRTWTALRCGCAA